jgi:hypothetical protein
MWGQIRSRGFVDKSTCNSTNTEYASEPEHITEEFQASVDIFLFQYGMTLFLTSLLYLGTTLICLHWNHHQRTLLHLHVALVWSLKWTLSWFLPGLTLFHIRPVSSSWQGHVRPFLKYFKFFNRALFCFVSSSTNIAHYPWNNEFKCKQNSALPKNFKDVETTKLTNIH